MLFRSNQPNSNSVITTFQKPLYLAVVQSQEIIVPFPVLLLSLDGSGNYIPCGYVPLASGNNIPNTYNYPIDNIFSAFVNYYNNMTKVGELNIGTNVYNIYDAGFIGASEIAFTFNDENSNKYAFQYMHSPLINSGNECVGTYISTESETNSYNRKISYLSSYSGIILIDTFTNLTIKNNLNNFVSDVFFDLLGLNYNDLISPDIRNIINIQSQNNQIDYLKIGRAHV